MAHTDLVASSFQTEKNMVTVTQLGREITFPSPVPPVKYVHILCGYEDWLLNKYRLRNFVEVEGGDIVIDCGAYVGGFSLSAACRADQVHAFEPEKQNFECLRCNTGEFENVICQNMGLYKETADTVLNISASSVEHSLLPPDDGDIVERRKIKITRLDDYCRVHDIPRIDFLKLEAEGVEPEIIEGLGDLKPRKLAIDVSPERVGLSPLTAIKPILEARGYETRVRGHLLFAHL